MKYIIFKLFLRNSKKCNLSYWQKKELPVKWAARLVLKASETSQLSLLQLKKDSCELSERGKSRIEVLVDYYQEYGRDFLLGQII